MIFINTARIQVIDVAIKTVWAVSRIQAKSRIGRCLACILIKFFIFQLF